MINVAEPKNISSELKSLIESILSGFEIGLTPDEVLDNAISAQPWLSGQLKAYGTDVSFFVKELRTISVDPNYATISPLLIDAAVKVEANGDWFKQFLLATKKRSF